MYAVQLMIDEHKNIKKVLGIIRKYCFKVLKNESVEYNDFYKIIDFVRNYADKHHHGKEEQMLFNKMLDELGSAGEKAVKHGMLVEHDLGRLYINNLEKAVGKVQEGNEEAKLDLIANAISYADLLYRHIEKEDNVIYKFAEKNLSEEALRKLDEESKLFEKEAENKGIQEKYTLLIEELER